MPSEKHRNAQTDRPNLNIYILCGLLVIILFFGLAGAWVGFAPLSSAVIASGVTSVESNQKTIQHLEGGIIDKIMVKEGTLVKKGQVLLLLDSTREEIKIKKLQGQEISNLAKKERLHAEIKGVEQLVFKNLPLKNIEHEDKLELLEMERDLFKSRRLNLRKNIGVLGKEIELFNEKIKGAIESTTSETRQLLLVREELTMVAGLVNKGFAPRIRLMKLRLREETLKSARARNISKVSVLRKEIVKANFQISRLKAEWTNKNMRELVETQNLLNSLGQEIEAARNVVERKGVRAPLEGTIVGLKVNTKGGVVAPGQALMGLVPAGEALVIDIKIDPTDIDLIKIGLPVQVRFTALNQRSTAPVEGVLRSFSADRIIDPKNGTAYYSGRVKIPEGSLSTLSTNNILPGMQAEVMILTRDNTLLDYFVKPISESFNRAFREE